MKINERKSVIFLLIAVQLNLGLCKRIRIRQKRQIYREQVQPHTGGKIPDSAFETDRLFLNRLQKEGIAVPDGVVLEQRNPKVFPYPNSDLRPVFKVVATSDDRFTDDAGQVLDYMPPVIETTYSIPRITEDRLPHNPIHTTVYDPIYRPFLLPNPLLQNPALSSNAIAPTFQKGLHTPFSNFQQFSPPSSAHVGNINYKYHPIAHSTVKYYYEDTVASQIFNDLTTFINQYRIPLSIPLTLN